MSTKPGSSVKSLYNVTLKQPADRDDELVGRMADALADRAVASSMMREGNDHRGPWVISWLVEGKPAIKELTEKIGGLYPGPGPNSNDWTIEKVPDIDWLAHSYQGFQPFAVGPFFIHGSHHETGAPSGLTGLRIDAATAFGSGEHATTAGCLRALADLDQEGFRPAAILDMGTGSGILAIAAARLWDVPVQAVDIEEEAVRVTNRHATMNGVAGLITAMAGDGFRLPAVREAAPYDLIFANILAGPLKDMAADLAGCLGTGGYAVLSGMLDEQADDVQKYYRASGMAAVRRYSDEGWTTLLLRG